MFLALLPVGRALIAASDLVRVAEDRQVLQRYWRVVNHRPSLRRCGSMHILVIQPFDEFGKKDAAKSVINNIL